MPLNKWGVNLCELNYGGGNKVNEFLFLYFCARERTVVLGSSPIHNQF